MAKKSVHYGQAIDRIHHREILNAFTEQKTPEFAVLVASSRNAVSVSLPEQHLYFSSEKEEVESEISHFFSEDSAEQIFRDCGGCVCEEVPHDWRNVSVFDEEEDGRFGDFPATSFQSLLRRVFGSPMSEQLAFDRRLT